MTAAWEDARYIRDASGEAVTVWSYKPGEGRRVDADALFSGIAPGSVAYFAEAVSSHGHAILETAGSRPWHHHVAGCGVGHDDAQFAESGTSFAAYLESGEAFGGHWWETANGRRHYLNGRPNFTTRRRQS